MPRKTYRRMKQTHKSRHKKTRVNKKRTQRRQKGGNYAKDITVNEIDGIPVKRNAVVTVPGRGTMSISAFQQLKSDIDRNGDDYYD